jgi:iron complex transport system permease protein
MVLLAAACVVAMAVGVAVGSSPIAWRDVWALLTSPAARAADPTGATVIWSLRLPRVAAAGLAGGCLGVAGVALQALLQNPLADPYVLGVSAGASAGAALVIALGVSAALAGFAIPLAALAGAVAATALVFGLAQSRGRLPGTTLLLSGVVVAAVLASLVSILLFLSGAEDKMAAIILWTMGGFGAATWPLVIVLTPLALVAGAGLWAMGRDLDLLAFGEDPARFLGADVERLKALVLFASAFLTACAVAVGGVIGFVGLIVPHAMRRIVGPAHRALIPAAFLGGAVFLTLADLAARRLHPPTEIPVGLLTGLLGGPFFLALLRAPGGRK